MAGRDAVTERAARQGADRLHAPALRALPGSHRGREPRLLHGHLRDHRRRARSSAASAISGFSNLLPFVDAPAGDLSGGMKQKLGLACVLVHEPRRARSWTSPPTASTPCPGRSSGRSWRRCKQAGMTMLVSTAYLDEGERCDRLLLMHNGRRSSPMAAPAEVRAGSSQPGGGHHPAHPGRGCGAHGGHLRTLRPSS
ncbi:MAG: hypothetical protein MZW92_21790 [Comamonadaceae bacterium]|nr:hypothetical protein [Comamonadaceae bacterium]